VPQKDVVVLVCAPDFEASTITVAASTSSAQAPTINKGTGCAQALADLVNQQFKIEHALASDQNNVIQYVLTRP
jgi:hypothetical protein